MIANEKTEKEVFCEEIDAFCVEFGLKPTVFGVACLNNGNFRADLNKSVFSPKLETVTRVRKWMRNQRIKRSKNTETL